MSLVLSTCPGLVQSALAAMVVGGDADGKNQSEATAPPSTPQELPDYRTPISQRFLNPDGSLTEKIYTHPIHFKEPSTGRLKSIDSSVVGDGRGKFRNRSNHFAVELQPTANAGYFKFSEEGATLAFRPLFASGVRGVVKNSLIEYKQVAANTDLAYAVTPSGLKETLTLHSAHAPTVFSFELSVENLTYKTQQNGAVIFSKRGSTAPLFTLARPFAVDASLEMSDKVAYHIHKGRNGKLLLDLEVDADWLQDPKRKFPVVIDPVIKTQNAPDVDDTLISSLHPYDNYGNWSHLYVGQVQSLGTTRSLLWFNLANLPSSAVISSANLNVKNTAVYTASKVKY